MAKYDLIPEKLIREGIISPGALIECKAMTEERILTVHDSDYLHKLNTGALSVAEMRKTGFPYSPQLIDREKRIMQATYEAALMALTCGVALNVAGGTHHAFTDRGEGFCLLNDLALGAQNLINDGLAKRILIVDLDVHQGNGTAAIFSGRDDVFTFSMHGEANYPMHKEKSHLDIPLADGTDDSMYLKLLMQHLSEVLEHFNPDFIFYQSGVDILKSDKLGRLGVSLEGCKQRDEFVLRSAYERNIPLCAAMGGGYSADVNLIVEAHCNTFRLADEIWRP